MRVVEAADTGSAAAAVVRQVLAAPEAPITLCVVGPGGTGKSLLLDEIARAYEDGGAEVIRHDPSTPAPTTTDAVVVVDDAHLLGPTDLHALAGLARGPARIVLASRPWPRPHALGTLVAAAPARQTVVLAHLDRERVAARVARCVGGTPPDALVDLVHEQSGGLPALVDLVATGLRDGGRYDPRDPAGFRAPRTMEISTDLAEMLRHLVDPLDPAVRALFDVLAVGAPLDPDVLDLMLDDPAGLDDTVEAARAGGLLTENCGLVPFVRLLVLRLMPVLRLRRLRQRLATVEMDRGGQVLAAARPLLGTRASGPAMAAVLETAGAEAAATDEVVLARRFLDEAVAAGGDPVRLAGRRAHVTALAGDLDAALALADGVLTDPAAADHDLAVTVASTALAHRGLLCRSAAMSLHLGGPRAMAAVPALIGTGEPAQAHAALTSATAASGGPSTVLQGVEELVARGLLAGVEGAGAAALSDLARASTLLEPVASGVLMPDTPAALTALVAIHLGEFSVADSTLRRAIRSRQGGRPAHARHVLLRGWTALATGRLEQVHRSLAAARVAPLEPRDELVAAALSAGLARRENDLAALATARDRARDALVHQPVDLYTLLPLGELAGAAALLGDREWIASYLKEADVLLDRLGNPPLWAVPLHWHRLHAALLGEDPGAVTALVESLTADAGSSPFAGLLACAATSWQDVWNGRIDADAVESAARRLAAAGMAWQGAYLAGEAARMSVERRAATALLACARSLHSGGGTLADTDEPDATVGDAGPGIAAAPVDPASENPVPEPAARLDGVLTEREIDIGRLILEGLTYRQIGERLYISSKTVEHYVARMRQRLGVGSRKEMFGRLRTLVDDAGPVPARPVAV